MRISRSLRVLCFGIAMLPMGASRLEGQAVYDETLCRPPVDTEAPWTAEINRCRAHLEAHPDDSIAYVGLALLESDSTRRLAVLDAGLRRLPTSALLHENRALTLRVLGRDTEALQAFDSALALGARHPSTFEEAGRIAFGLGQTERAVELLRESVRRDPESGRAWLALAPVEATLGRHREALAAWETAFRLTGDRQLTGQDSALAARSRSLVGPVQTKPANRSYWAFGLALAAGAVFIAFRFRRAAA